MAKAVASGYYGYGNLGDELILRGLVSELKRLDPQGQVTVLSASPRQTRRDHGVKAVFRWNPFTIFWAILTCDVFISGGGGLIQDSSGPLTPAYYLSFILLAKMLGKKTVGWGQSVGPITNGFNRWLTSWIFRKTDLFMVRDEFSYQFMLEQAGYPKAKLVLGADLVFSLPLPGPSGPKSLGPGYIAVVLRDGLTKVDQPVLCDLLAQIHRRTKLNFTFLSLQDDRDFKVIQDIRDNLIAPSAIRLPPADLSLLLPIFSRAKFVLSMRYHALILAALAQTPSAALSSNPKINSFVAGFGQLTFCADGMLDREGSLGVFNKLWRHQDKLKQSLAKGQRQCLGRLKTAETRLKGLLRA